MVEIAVALEVTGKRVFATALEWPGWSRSGKTEEAALAALADYTERYEIVAKRAGVRFKAHPFAVTERLTGNATTEFGAPGQVAEADRAKLTAAQAERRVDLLEAVWALFDEVVAGAPETLKKGPRGGGRDRDPIVAHVLGAEAGYARQIGLKLKEPDPADATAVAAHRAAIADVLRAARSGEPLREKGWPARYAAQRFAWHALDHAWEIQDKS